MAVVDHVPLGLLLVKVLLACLMLADFGNDVHVNRDGILANVDSQILSNFHLLVPRMGTDALDGQSLLWVSAKNFPDQVLASIAHKLRYLVLSIQDLVIQLIGLRVFERKETTYHSIDDNSTAPHIRRQAIVLLASHHFWSCIARTATCGLQKLTWFIRVTQTKINNLDVIEVIHQKILRLQIPVANAQLVQIVDP